VPSLFALTKDWHADRFVRELAYPIYITHFLFAWPSTAYGEYAGYVCAAVAIVVSVALYCGVQVPVDRARHRFAKLAPA
jgi:hypothetical protein